MSELDEIKRIPLDVITKMKQSNPGHHLCDVVQGLIENSIDAHCSQIKILLENDGLSSIKIIDDGIGIPKSSLPNVCRFHCTSKIQDITKTEIIHGKSFGFTGSFLANLSCVSKIKISTKFHKEDKSNFAFYEYNVITKSGDCFEIDNGTCVEVINFLNNFPKQRLKILKNQKEINKMIDTIAKYSIVYSWIKFKVILNDRRFLETYGNTDFLTNLAYMHQFQEPLKIFQVSSFEKLDDNVEATIFLSNPRYNYLTTNKNSPFLLRAIFLNGRLISAPSLKKSINKMYDNEIKRMMSNYFIKTPYFIFIKAPEVFTNDVFDENDIDADLNEDSEYSDFLKEEKCYFQKFMHFKCTEKLIQKCYQIMSEFQNPPKEIQVANEVRRLENKLISEYLCNPPRIKDISKFLFSISQQPQNSLGIQGQSSLSPLSSTSMSSILAPPKQMISSQTQPHSSFLGTTRITTQQQLQDQQQKQNQSQSPFLSTSRISPQQSLQDQQQMQVQVQIQPKSQTTTTILTPKHTVHPIAKSPVIIKKSVSPAPSSSQFSQLPPPPLTTTTSSGVGIASITREPTTVPITVSSVLNSNSEQRIQKVQPGQTSVQQVQTIPIQQSSTQKTPPRGTDINDLLTNNAAQPQVSTIQPVVSKRVLVRKHTAPLLNVSSNQNLSNGGSQQQSQNSAPQSVTSSGPQSQTTPSNSQPAAQAAPVIRIRKVVPPPPKTSS